MSWDMAACLARSAGLAAVLAKWDTAAGLTTGQVQRGQGGNGATLAAQEVLLEPLGGQAVGLQLVRPLRETVSLVVEDDVLDLAPKLA
jgi:hypothetical protein